jgi:hypothetical protein
LEPCALNGGCLATTDLFVGATRVADDSPFRGGALGRRDIVAARDAAGERQAVGPVADEPQVQHSGGVFGWQSFLSK